MNNNKWLQGENVGDVLSWRRPEKGPYIPQRSCPDVAHLIPPRGRSLGGRRQQKPQLIGLRGSSLAAYWRVGPPLPRASSPAPARRARSLHPRENLEVERGWWCGTRRPLRAREGPGPRGVFRTGASPGPASFYSHPFRWLGWFL